MSQFQRVIGTRSTAGDGTAVIAAPTSDKEVRLYFVQLQAEASGTVTVLINGGATAVDRIRCAGDGQGKLREYTDRNCIRCGAGNAVYVNLSDAVQVGYILEYLVVAV